MTTGYEKWHGIELPADIVRELSLKRMAELREQAEAIDASLTRPDAEPELDELMTNNDEVQQSKKDAEKRKNSEIQADFDWQSEIIEGPKLLVYDNYKLQQHAKSLEEVTSHDDKDRAIHVLKTLDRLGDYRRLKQISEDWRIELKTLEEKFPNFLEVIDYLREASALSECSLNRRVLELENILLEGLPGTGKSFFCEALADFLGSGRVCLRMEVAQASSCISGSDAFWSNSKSGSVFDSIALSLTTGARGHSYANPLFIIDEVDKIDTGGRYNPESALLSLFEKSTAEKFSDLCHPWLSIDASKISWIATCNDSEQILAPLLSRMRRFIIEQPTPDQALAIAQNIVDEVRLNYYRADVTFDESALAALCTLSPRRMRAEAKSAIGRVLYRQRGLVVSAADIDVEKPRRRIGFL